MALNLFFVLDSTNRSELSLMCCRIKEMPKAPKNELGNWESFGSLLINYNTADVQELPEAPRTRCCSYR